MRAKKPLPNWAAVMIVRIQATELGLDRFLRAVRDFRGQQVEVSLSAEIVGEHLATSVSVNADRACAGIGVGADE